MKIDPYDQRRRCSPTLNQKTTAAASHVFLRQYGFLVSCLNLFWSRCWNWRQTYWCCDVAGEVSVRESRRGDGDGSDDSLWKDERLRPQQGRFVQEGAGHCVQSEHSVHVEEGIHARVLTRSKIDELLLFTDQTDEAWTRTQDVRQGTTLQANNNSN